MFARPSPPEPQRRPSHFSSHPSAARSNGAYSKTHRVRGDEEQYRDHGSLKRQISLPDREGKRVQTRDWHVKPELPSHSTSQHNEAGLADAGPGGTVSIPRAVKAAQHVAAPGPTSLGSAAPVSLGLGAFQPGVPPGLPAYFRNGVQGQSVTNSDGHSGQWGSAGQGQSAGHIAHAREVPDSGMSGAFSKPTEGNPVPRPKSLRRSANPVYIAHMIVEWQHQFSRLRHQKSYQQPAADLQTSHIQSLAWCEVNLAVVLQQLPASRLHQSLSSKNRQLPSLSKAHHRPLQCHLWPHPLSSSHPPSVWLLCGPPHPSTPLGPGTAQATSFPQHSTTRTCSALRSLRLYSLGCPCFSLGPHGLWGPLGDRPHLSVCPPC